MDRLWTDQSPAEGVWKDCEVKCFVCFLSMFDAHILELVDYFWWRFLSWRREHTVHWSGRVFCLNSPKPQWVIMLHGVLNLPPLSRPPSAVPPMSELNKKPKTQPRHSEGDCVVLLGYNASIPVSAMDGQSPSLCLPLLATAAAFLFLSFYYTSNQNPSACFTQQMHNRILSSLEITNF